MNAPAIEQSLAQASEHLDALEHQTTGAETGNNSNNGHPEPPPVIPIVIPRDLAVQIVGSDAGKEKRFRPQSTMTKGAPAEEITLVAGFMQPFLNHEIARFHVDRHHHHPEHRGNATPEQALAIKGFCLRYATHVRKHLDRHEHGDRHHCTQQRLDQTYDLLKQINTALGTPYDDGRQIGDVANELMVDLKSIATKLNEFAQRVHPPLQADPFPISPFQQSLLGLREAINGCLSMATNNSAASGVVSTPGSTR